MAHCTDRIPPDRPHPVGARPPARSRYTRPHALLQLPLSIPKADQLIGVLTLSERSRLLDAGCGTGAFLIRAVRTSGAAGLGIDLDEHVIARAREDTASDAGPGTLEFCACDAANVGLDGAAFDVALSIGSTHAFGSGSEAFPATLGALRNHLRSGGRMLIGEAYWMQPPVLEYLRFLGDPPGVYRTHAQNIELAETFNLRPIYAAVSNDDEWGHFEWSHHQHAIQQASEHPDPARAAEAIERIIAWRDAYLRWGRSTMGFGFYVLENPISAACACAC